MERSVLLLEREIATRTPVDQGRLRNSITGEVTRQGGTVQGVVYAQNVEHAPYVEYGSVPHFPPLKPIEDWVRRKGLGGQVQDGKLTSRAPKNAVRRIAFLIARKISRQGTRGAHMFRDGAAAATPEIQRHFTLAIRRVLRQL
jgi:hypothetical protein